MILNNFNTGFQAVNSSLDLNASKSLSSLGVSSWSGFDLLFPLLFVGVVIAGMYLVRRFPEFRSWIIPVAIVLFILVGFFAMIVENFWEKFSTHSAFSGLVSSFPITDFFLDYYVVVAIIGLLFIFVAGVVRNE